MYKIVETDNYGGDYPDEKFLNLPRMQKEHAEKIAAAINGAFPADRSRYWFVAPETYVLKPGFEP